MSPSGGPPGFRCYTPTPKNVERALSSVGQWYMSGSGLFNSARTLREAGIEGFKTSYVGEVDGADCSADDMLQENKYRVIHMLEGMAIEAWMKGLLCASCKKPKTSLESRISELVDQKLMDAGHASAPTIDQIFEAYRQPDVEALLNEISERDRKVYRERSVLIREHGSHDLPRMARAVKFNPTLSRAAIDSLKFFSQMIELGRYPSIKKARQLVKIGNEEAFTNGREEILRAIFTKRNQLEFGE